MQKPKADFEDEMRPAYGRALLGKGARGKHFAEYQAGTNVAFPDEADRAVNDPYVEPSANRSATGNTG